jgi:hypothetical protein
VGWFTRQLQGRSAREVEEDHARFLRASGLDRALSAFAGPFGRRRFVVYFALRGAVVVVNEVATSRLPGGGGPPRADVTGKQLVAVERALTQLHRNMANGARWDRGAVGFVRELDGRPKVMTWFDEDVDQKLLERLPIPALPGHPLESPAWEQMRGRFEAQFQQVAARSRRANMDLTRWEVDRAGFLTLETGQTGQMGFDRRRLRCVVMARFEPKPGRLFWEVNEPLFDEEPFNWTDLSCDLEAALEVAMLATARLGADRLFAPATDAAGTLLLVAVRDG